MISKEDISQIRKYLNGELDAKGMHELERRALDDPFLKDALEGYEQTEGDQKSNLDELTTRLQQRTEKKQARIIPWRTVSVAASVLIAIGAGVWFFSGPQPAQTARVAGNIRPEPKATHIAGHARGKGYQSLMTVKNRLRRQLLRRFRLMLTRPKQRRPALAM